jgi:hypothetical protein
VQPRATDCVGRADRLRGRIDRRTLLDRSVSCSASSLQSTVASVDDSRFAIESRGDLTKDDGFAMKAASRSRSVPSNQQPQT